MRTTVFPICWKLINCACCTPPGEVMGELPSGVNGGVPGGIGQGIADGDSMLPALTALTSLRALTAPKLRLLTLLGNGCGSLDGCEGLTRGIRMLDSEMGDTGDGS